MGPITKAAMQQYKKQVTKDFKDNKIPYKNQSYLMDWEKLGKQAIENKQKNIEIASGMGNILENYGKQLKNNYEEKQQIRSSAYEKANKNNPYRYVSPNNLSKLQEELWKAGAFKGVKDRKGKEATFKSAVDGIRGNMTTQAIQNAKSMGFNIDENSGTISKLTPSKLSQNSRTTSKVTLPKLSQIYDKVKTKVLNTFGNSQELEDNGHAIYLHYPNFVGSSKNAFKLGDFDPGEVLGNPQLPVGHAATILIDNEGNSNYYEYGRYEPKNGHLIGSEQRPTVKGGNWRQFKLPKQNPGENDSVYVARIQHLLPDTKTGAYQAMSIPSVDVKRATDYIFSEANNKNRDEYGIFNTCATGACNATLKFRKNKLNNTENSNNRQGYSEGALNWSKLPFTTDSYAQKARKAASNVYIMNNKL